MRQNFIFKALIAFAIALLTVGVAGCDSFSTGNIIQRGENNKVQNLETAMLISKQAPVSVSFLANDTTLQKVFKSGDISRLKKNLFTSTNIDYKKDIQPWLGDEITLSVTTPDLDHNPENGKQPGYLMVLTSEDSQKSREFIEVYFSQRVLAGNQLSVEKYKGIKIISDTPPLNGTQQGGKNSKLAVATLSDRLILFSNHPSVLRETVNNIQASKVNLSSYLPYQQAVKQLPKKPVAVAFLNFKQIAAWKGLEIKDLSYENQILSLSETPQGLLVQTSLVAEEETLPPTALLSESPLALEYIPPEASLAIAGVNLHDLHRSNLSQFWQQNQLKILPNIEKSQSGSFNPFTDIEKSYGLKLSKDIFSWVKGEYALGMIPKSDSTEWVFVTEKFPDTEKGIARLDEIAVNNSLIVSPLSIEKGGLVTTNSSLSSTGDDETRQVSAWTKLTTKSQQFQKEQASSEKEFSIQAKIYGVHTSIDNYEVFASSVETINNVLRLSGNSILDNRKFKDSIARIPQQNQGYIYLDWEKSKRQLEDQIPIIKLAEIAGKPFFDKLRSLTVSSYNNQDNILNIGVLFDLK